MRKSKAHFLRIAARGFCFRTAVTVVTIACGSTTDDGLFGERRTGTGGSSAGGGTGGIHADGQSPDGGSGGPPEGSGGETPGGSGGATDSGTGGTIGDGGTAPDASGGGADAGDDASVTGGNGGGGTTAVRCGGGACDTTGGATCCVRQAFPGAPDMFSCVVDTTDCNQHLECDGDSDCGSEVCCLIPIQFTTQFHSECRPSCSSAIPFGCGGKMDCAPGETCCGTTGAQGYTDIRCESTCAAQVLCDVEADCGQNQTCRDSALLPGGVSVCF